MHKEMIGMVNKNERRFQVKRFLLETKDGVPVLRAIDQAYWNTAYMYKKPRDMLIKWSKEVDNEITRKRQEYHLDG